MFTGGRVAQEGQAGITRGGGVSQSNLKNQLFEKLEKGGLSGIRSLEMVLLCSKRSN